MQLSGKKCKPCEGGVIKLTSEEILSFNSSLSAAWKIIDDIRISREFHFKNYSQTIEFVNKIAEMAESEGHHPVLHVYFNFILVELWTHAILGLSENDFILASKINDLYL
jgi:4a-hydroxytetrahydrobiopterin dehydratase